MLSVTCRVGESLRIGERIVVKVLDVQGQKVRLGVEAPKDVRITRSDAGEPARPAPRPK